MSSSLFSNERSEIFLEDEEFILSINRRLENDIKKFEYLENHFHRISETPEIMQFLSRKSERETTEGLLQLVLGCSENAAKKAVNESSGSYSKTWIKLLANSGSRLPSVKTLWNDPKSVLLSIYRPNPSQEALEKYIDFWKPMIRMSYNQFMQSLSTIWKEQWTENEARNFSIVSASLSKLRSSALVKQILIKSGQSERDANLFQKRCGEKLIFNVLVWGLKWRELNLHGLFTKEAIPLISFFLNIVQWESLRIVTGIGSPTIFNGGSQGINTLFFSTGLQPRGILRRVIKLAFYGNWIHHYSESNTFYRFLSDAMSFRSALNTEIMDYNNGAAIELLRG